MGCPQKLWGCSVVCERRGPLAREGALRSQLCSCDICEAERGAVLGPLKPENAEEGFTREGRSGL